MITSVNGGIIICIIDCIELIAVTLTALKYMEIHLENSLYKKNKQKNNKKNQMNILLCSYLSAMATAAFFSLSLLD